MNNEPIIYVTSIHFSKDEVQIMGKNQDTVKIEKNGIAYMKFFAKELIKELEDAPDDLVMNVIGRANLNEWMGRVTPQIFIDDYEILDGKLEF